jgi:hypothetical protein
MPSKAPEMTTAGFAQSIGSQAGMPKYHVTGIDFQAIKK